MPLLSETSDYGSGTDPEQQSVQHVSPPIATSSFKFDLDETSYSYSVDEHHPSSLRRTSLYSSSSSSSSSPTSPSSSISNLSSLSSSSELQRSFHQQTRLTSKKLFSINNNNTTSPSTAHPSNEMNTCYCDKENLPARKRNRPTTYVSRRSITPNHCESCQLKRTKVNSTRPKYFFNRQHPTRKACCYSPYTDLSSTRFTVDLTGLNIDYTVEYHDSNKCTYPTAVLPYYHTCSTINRCRCSSSFDWGGPSCTSAPVYNPSDNYHPEFYYPNVNASSWISAPLVPVASTLFNYHDFYWTRFPNDHLSSIYFDDHLLRNMDQSQALHHLRHVPPVIERECEKNIFAIENLSTNSWRSDLFSSSSSSPYRRMSSTDRFSALATQPPPTRSWLRMASPNNSQPTAIFTVMNYNILCDKYATRHVYGYCPSWALKWEYRRKQIFDELRSYAADIIALQVRKREGLLFLSLSLSSSKWKENHGDREHHAERIVFCVNELCLISPSKHIKAAKWKFFTSKYRWQDALENNLRWRMLNYTMSVRTYPSGDERGGTQRMGSKGGLQRHWERSSALFCHVMPG